MERRAQRIFFGVANAITAVLVLETVWQGLPSRWWPVDGSAIAIAALLGASSIALVAHLRFAERLARVAAFVTLILGLVGFASVALTASWLHGVYGPIGKGGAAIFGLVAALVLPYLVVLPAAELVWLGPARPPKS
jgi:hypothetical protein